MFIGLKTYTYTLIFTLTVYIFTLYTFLGTSLRCGRLFQLFSQSVHFQTQLFRFIYLHIHFSQSALFQARFFCSTYSSLSSFHPPNLFSRSSDKPKTYRDIACQFHKDLEEEASGQISLFVGLVSVSRFPDATSVMLALLFSV